MLKEDFNPDEDHVERPTILVAEDDSDMLRYLYLELNEHYDVIKAVNGVEGLEQALETIPDLIITDIMMPVMDGVELCRQLKSNLHTSHIPIIMLTAKASVENQIEGLECGADDYVTKPFHTTLLKARVHNLLESRRLIKEQLSREFPLISEQVYSEDMVEHGFLKRAIRVVEEHISESEFNPDRFADIMNMSVSSLHRKMRALTDRTPMQMISEIRIRHAAKLLTSSSLNMTEIAFEVGYDGLTQFGRHFKAQYGITPSQYRADKS